MDPQGHAQAQNVRDSGIEVLISQRSGSKNHDLAKKHGFNPLSIDEVVAQSDIIQILIPDEFQKTIYEESILPKLSEGKALVFSQWI